MMDVPEFISLLTGKAFEWAMAIWEAQDTALTSYEQFLGQGV